MTSVVTSVIADNEKTVIKEWSLNAQQVAGTYTIATATGGDIYIKSAKVYVGTAITTLTSMQIKTSSATSVNLMSAVEGAVAGLIADTMLVTAFTGPLILASGKLIQMVLVGSTGAGGPATLVVEYMRSKPGADLI